MKNPFKDIKTLNRKQLIDDAFKQASKSAERLDIRDKKIEIARQREGLRVKIVGNFLVSQIKDSIRSFPDFDKISEIHYKLTDGLIGINNLKISLDSLNRTANEIRRIQMKSFDRLKTARTTFDCRDIRKEFYGRIVYFFKKNKKDLDLIYDAFILKKLPDFKEMPTIIIAGLPNVGKTSLLKCLTGSEPEIETYPFTTKGLMLGYSKNIQFVDTPGLLDRPLEKRNKIEKQSIAALEKLADAIIYIFDLSETCGYSLERQGKLYEEIKKTFDKPIIIVANKCDIIGSKTLQDLNVDHAIPISCETKFNIQQLELEISKNLKV